MTKKKINNGSKGLNNFQKIVELKNKEEKKAKNKLLKTVMKDIRENKGRKEIMKERNVTNYFYMTARWNLVVNK